MIWGIIGISSGIVMGLSGAGAAIIAVPLFVQLGGITVNHATFYSLFAVLLSALMNWFFQRKQTDYKAALIIFLFSLPSSFFLAKLKALAPEGVVQIAFLTICLLSVILTWIPKKSKDAHHHISHSLTKMGLGGIILGAVSTFTGLGGGVILMPFFRWALHYPQSKAIATCLLTVSLGVVGSIASQITVSKISISPFEVLLLILGCLISSVVVKSLIQKLSPKRMEDIRNITLTFVVLVAFISLLL